MDAGMIAAKMTMSSSAPATAATEHALELFAAACALGSFIVAMQHTHHQLFQETG